MRKRYGVRRVRRGRRLQVKGKRHWASSAASAVSAGVSAAKSAHSVYKRARHAYSGVKKLIGRKRGPARPAQTGVFTRCVERRVSSGRRKNSGFDAKVMSSIYRDIPINKLVYGLTFRVQGENAVGKNVSWFQIAMDPLIDLSYNCAQILNLSVTENSNPSGLTAISFTSGTNSSGTSTAQAVPCINRIISNVSNFGPSPIMMGVGLANKEVKYRYGSSMMYMTLRNPTNVGGRLEMYVVKPKKNLASFTLSGIAVSAPPIGWNPATTSCWRTPLELAARGLTRTGGGATFAECPRLTQSRFFGLKDSPEFLDNYKIVSKCSVYMPAGGSINKNFFRKGSVSLDTTKLESHIQLSLTSFVVCRYIPEVMYNQFTAGDPANGVGLPLNCPTISGYGGDFLIGTLDYSHSVKQFVSISAQENKRTAMCVPNYFNTTAMPIGQAATTHTEL